jgi:8-oxo-dGTP pyrophosphatase MutT (NUDIX family)
MTQIEYVTLVDNHGRARKTVARSEAKKQREVLLARGLYMPVVAAVIFDRLGRILVHRRGTSGHTADVHTGALDHIYGGLPSDMDPEAAARKEIFEETGVTNLETLYPVSAGITANKFYRHFYTGATSVTDAELQVLVQALATPDETTWVGFLSLQELQEKQRLGTEQFTGAFFEDIELARHFLAHQ